MSSCCNSEPATWPGSNISARCTSAKRRWTREEHQHMLALAASYDTHPPVWAEVAKQLPGRTPKQCRERYLNFAGVPKRLRGERWSEHEDRTIAGFHSSSREGVIPWCQVVCMLEGRTQNQIKNHWNSVFRAKDIHTRKGSWLCLYINALREGSQPDAATHAADAAWTKQLEQAEADKQAAARAYAAAATQEQLKYEKVKPVRPLLPESEIKAIAMARAWRQAGASSSAAAACPGSGPATQAVTAAEAAAALASASAASSSRATQERTIKAGALTDMAGATSSVAASASAATTPKDVDHASCVVLCAAISSSRSAMLTVTEAALHCMQEAVSDAHVSTTSAVCAGPVPKQQPLSAMRAPFISQATGPASPGAVGRRCNVYDVQATAATSIAVQGRSSTQHSEIAMVPAAATFRHGTAAYMAPSSSYAPSVAAACDAPAQHAQGEPHSHAAAPGLQQTANASRLQYGGDEESQKQMRVRQSAPSTRAWPSTALQNGADSASDAAACRRLVVTEATPALAGTTAAGTLIDASVRAAAATAQQGICVPLLRACMPTNMPASTGDWQPPVGSAADAATITAAAAPAHRTPNSRSLDDPTFETPAYRCSWGGSDMLGTALEANKLAEGVGFEDLLDLELSDTWLDLPTDAELNSLLVAGSGSHRRQASANGTAAGAASAEAGSTGALLAACAAPAPTPVDFGQSEASPKAMQSDEDAVQMMQQVQLRMALESQVLDRERLRARSALPNLSPNVAMPAEAGNQPFHLAAAAAPGADLNNIAAVSCPHAAGVSAPHAAPQAVLGTSAPLYKGSSQSMSGRDGGPGQHTVAVSGGALPWADDVSMAAVPGPLTHGPAPPAWACSTTPAVQSGWLPGLTTACCAYSAADAAAMQPWPEPSNSQPHHLEQKQRMPTRPDSGSFGMPPMWPHASMHSGRMHDMSPAWGPAGSHQPARHAAVPYCGLPADSADGGRQGPADGISMAPCACCKHDWMHHPVYDLAPYGYPPHWPMRHPIRRPMRCAPRYNPYMDPALYDMQYMATEQMPVSMHTCMEGMPHPGYAHAAMAGAEPWMIGHTGQGSMPCSYADSPSVPHSMCQQFNQDAFIHRMPAAGVDAYVGQSVMGRSLSGDVHPMLSWGYEQQQRMHLDPSGPMGTAYDVMEECIEDVQHDIISSMPWMEVAHASMHPMEDAMHGPGIMHGGAHGLQQNTYGRFRCN